MLEPGHEAPAALPAHASVVVIGGGVMGCSTLYHLAKLGAGDAILLERDRLTSGTTWHSAAQVRALRSSRGLTEMIRYSIDLYAGLEAETGQATGWINRGSLSIATTPDRLVHIRRQESLAHAFGVPAHAVSPGEAGERWPLMNAADVVGAVWSPADGRVNPSDLCAALAKGARARGARIFEHTPVTGVVTEAGRVRAVETGAGTVRCEAVALCTGLWSRACAAMAGVSAPVYPCEHFYLLTKPVPGAERHLPSLSDHDGHLYIRDEVGGLLVGCFEPGAKPIDPESLGADFAFGLLPEDWDHFEPMMANALHRLPVLETAQVRMLLNGPESFTPDGAFLLGESCETRGFFLGCGMNSMGVGSGGGAGMALAHTVVHGRAPFDLHEVHPGRFHPCESALPALAARAPEVLGKHYEIAYPGRQFASARNLRRGPLDERWRAARARFGQVYGFERPLYFGAPGEPVLTFSRPDWFERVAAEVRCAHEEAAMFDHSTFGKIDVEGPDAERFLDRVCANDLRRAPGRVVYTPMLHEDGGFASDLTVQRLGDEHYRLLVGTTAIAHDLAWLRRRRGTDERVRFVDRTGDLAILALAGPSAREVVAALGGGDVAGLRYYRHAAGEMAGVPVRVARLSFSGESGFEITCDAGDATRLHDALAAEGVAPAGAYALASMRIEKRFLAMGSDIDGGVTPLEAGLDFAVAWDSDFVGRDALLRRRESGPRSAVVGIVLEDPAAVPLGGEPVYAGGAIVGQTTSAAFGHRTGLPVALATVSAGGAHAAAGARVQVDVAGERFAGTVHVRPVFDPGGARMRA